MEKVYKEMIPKNFRLKSLHWLFMSILMIAAIASAFHTSSASSTSSATVFVDPPQTILTGATVGTKFQVNVTIANITSFIGSQFNLSWNATLLNCTGIQENLYHVVTPTDFLNNIQQYMLDFNNTGGYAEYAYTYLNNAAALAAGYAPINITTTNYPPEGKLALAVLNFTVISVPPTNTYYDCNLTLTHPTDPTIDPVIGDQDSNQIPTVNVDGYYRIYGPPETVTSSVLNNGTTYNIITVSNATVVPDSMTYNSTNFTLSFNLTAAANGGTTAYVNVTIPKDVVALANETDHWNVTVNGTPVTPTWTKDSTNTYLYFTTGLSVDKVQIVGTIPEFPVLMIIPLLMIVTLIAVGFRRRRQI